MTFIFGTRRFGKVDHVPGLFYVVTSFHHLWFFPLIPVESYVIVEGTGGRRGLPIALCLKSVLIAWLRGALYVSTFFVTGGVVLEACNHFPTTKPTVPVNELVYVALVAVMLFCGLCLTYTCSGPGRDRARRLAARLGISEGVLSAKLGPGKNT
jgi:hypothetical protein